MGVDSGGTKTRVMLAALPATPANASLDTPASVLGEGLGGCSNYQYVGEARAVAEINAAIDMAFAQAGLSRCTVESACFGIGGADTPEDMLKARRWVDDNHWAAHSLTVNDGMLPLYAACPDGQGVSLIAGTGAIVWAQTREGRVARASGWGYLLGDEGSGWDLGHEALRHIARAEDGRGPRTALSARVLAHWHMQTTFDVIRRLYQPEIPFGDVAALARLVLECAAEGDGVALQIAQNGAGELALAAKAAIDALGMALPLTLAYSGSLLIKGLFYRQLFAQACQRLIGDVHLVPVEDPVRGAVAAARLLMQQA
jgi:N-acetylglucosamine kinase-like BadF-type ATPase